jgi:hypothetical protein
MGELVGHSEWGSSAVVSPDDGYILSAGRAEADHDGPAPSMARLWNAETGELAIAFVGFPDSVVAATFRPDGDELLFSDGLYVYTWPAPMISVFAAAYGEAVGVQMPVPTTENPSTPVPTATSAVTPAPTPTLIPTVTLTPTPTASPPPVSLDIFCTVTADRLNLRPGPGTNYNPPLGVLETGEILLVVGRNADGSWLQVAVVDDFLEPETIGWVSADFLFCVGNVEDAPVVEVE